MNALDRMGERTVLRAERRHPHGPGPVGDVRAAPGARRGRVDRAAPRGGCARLRVGGDRRRRPCARVPREAGGGDPRRHQRRHVPAGSRGPARLAPGRARVDRTRDLPRGDRRRPSRARVRVRGLLAGPGHAREVPPGALRHDRGPGARRVLPGAVDRRRGRRRPSCPPGPLGRRGRRRVDRPRGPGRRLRAAARRARGRRGEVAAFDPRAGGPGRRRGDPGGLGAGRGCGRARRDVADGRAGPRRRPPPRRPERAKGQYGSRRRRWAKHADRDEGDAGGVRGVRRRRVDGDARRGGRHGRFRRHRAPARARCPRLRRRAYGVGRHHVLRVRGRARAGHVAVGRVRAREEGLDVPADPHPLLLGDERDEAGVSGADRAGRIDL